MVSEIGCHGYLCKYGNGSVVLYFLLKKKKEKKKKKASDHDKIIYSMYKD